MTTVEDIKDRLDIVEVIGQRVQLRKQGQTYKGLCPFHTEKTPSFVVFPDSQRWQCFGACNEGGDVFDFVTKHEGWEFRTAMLELAKMAGLEPPRSNPEAEAKAKERQSREMVFAAAASWFQQQLPASPGETYALDRGWTAETIACEALGYYSGDAKSLRNALIDAGVDVAQPAAQAVLKTPSGMLVYAHRRRGRVTYLAGRSTEGKRHWNMPRELAGVRLPYFNSYWKPSESIVVIVEGQGDAVTLAQWEIPAIALAGCGTQPALIEILKRHRTVVVALDQDDAGEQATRTLANTLGPMVRLLEWPDHDANDWLKAGGTAEDAQGLMRLAPTWIDVQVDRAAAADRETQEELVREVFRLLATLDAFALRMYRENVANTLKMGLGTFDGLLRIARQELGLDEHGQPSYIILGGRICRRANDKYGGETIIPLCNFDARIVEDVVEDDGESQERRFAIEGGLGSGDKLPRIEVEAGEFSQMGWVLPLWGARAAVSAGSAMKDHLRMGIQTLSSDIETRWEYSHLGWRRINGKQIYLSSAGAVGMEGVQVATIQDLARYRLPTYPRDVQAAMRASLAMLETGDEQMTLPIWAAMYLAPLSSIIPPSFTLWLFGTTGGLKSTAVALAMCHYGKFSYNTPPASWTGTTNALEKKAFLVKDAPLWIDDYTAQSTSSGMREIQKKADQLLRDWGNRSGRSRMRADLKLRATFVPRGLIISTAEQLPPGQSILSRLYAVEATPGMMKIGPDSPLTRAQLEESLLYPNAMAGYVTWLSEHYEELQERLPGELLTYTERAREAGRHLRMPANVATMYIGLEMALAYAREVGAVAEDDAEAIKEFGWSILVGIGEQQHQVVSEEKPVEMYLDAIEQMLTTGHVYLKHKDQPENSERFLPKSRTAQSEMIGWYDGHFWYLLPKVAFQRVWEFYRSSGVMFPDSERGVRVKLLEDKLLLPQGGRFTYRLWLSSQQAPRVLRISRPSEPETGSLLDNAGSSGSSGRTGTDPDENDDE